MLYGSIGLDECLRNIGGASFPQLDGFGWGRLKEEDRGGQLMKTMRCPDGLLSGNAPVMGRAPAYAERVVDINSTLSSDTCRPYLHGHDCCFKSSNKLGYVSRTLIFMSVRHP